MYNMPAEFDYNLLLAALSAYKNPRDKIRSLINDGEIIRIKKGIYVLGNEYKRPYNTFVLANLIYGPSYVSGLSALSFHGAIPERVHRVYSITPNRNKIFTTKAGIFEYRYCHIEKYSTGFALYKTDSRKKALIATPEKALTDHIAGQKEIKTKADMKSYLSGMRLEKELYASLNISLMRRIAEVYNSTRINILLDTLIRITKIC